MSSYVDSVQLVQFGNNIHPINEGGRAGGRLNPQLVRRLININTTELLVACGLKYGRRGRESARDTWICHDDRVCVGRAGGIVVRGGPSVSQHDTSAMHHSIRSGEKTERSRRSPSGVYLHELHES